MMEEPLKKGMRDLEEVQKVAGEMERYTDRKRKYRLLFITGSWGILQKKKD